MTDEQDAATRQQKIDLLRSLSDETYYLRQVLSQIVAAPADAVQIATEGLASYMSASGWVRQTDDGKIVLGR